MNPMPKNIKLMSNIPATERFDDEETRITAFLRFVEALEKAQRIGEEKRALSVQVTTVAVSSYISTELQNRPNGGNQADRYFLFVCLFVCLFACLLVLRSFLSNLHCTQPGAFKASAKVQEGQLNCGCFGHERSRDGSAAKGAQVAFATVPKVFCRQGGSGLVYQVCDPDCFVCTK